MKAENVKKIKLGSVYINDEAVAPASDVEGESAICLGDTVPRKELQWIQAGNMLVADRCACFGVRWDTMNELGYIFGTVVQINGCLYLCRSLRIGERKTDPNEWDSLLDQFGEDNRRWHWKKAFFFGQESLPGHPEFCMIRGYNEAKFWYNWGKSDYNPEVGFRPVLEPIITELTDIVVGSNIKVVGPHGDFVEGTSSGFDDYNLTLTVSTMLSGKFDWITLHNQQIVAARSAIIGITKSDI